MRITDIVATDVRFPTSRDLDGSDAMNEAPDYSCAYVVLKTDGDHQGHGLTFTLGRGTEICIAAIESMKPLLLGQDLEAIASDMGAFWKHVTGDYQLRWIGPDKGAVHLATAALVNVVWDLWARAEGKPLWQLVCDLTPRDLVRCLDFQYMSDFLTEAEATAHLEEMAPRKPRRIAELEQQGIPGYTTAAGWLGYEDEKVRRLAEEAVREGWTAFKLKIGRDLDEDRRRAAIMRDVIGNDRRFMVDANQVWDVDEAIEWMTHLAEYRPWFIEEPTNPDDVLGHAAIREALAPHGVGVATGEHAMNRVLFKQIFQSEAVTVCQPDPCRLGGVNEFLLVQLMAATKGIPVCPHGGGVGLCEHVQHLAAIDHICMSGPSPDRFVEYVDHLHENFTDPVEIKDGHYVLPSRPGYSTEMKSESVKRYAFPDGPEWRDS